MQNRNLKFSKVGVSDNHYTEEYSNITLEKALLDTYKAYKNNPPWDGYSSDTFIIFKAFNIVGEDDTEESGDESLYMILYWDTAFGGRLCRHIRGHLSQDNIDSWCQQG